MKLHHFIISFIPTRSIEGSCMTAPVVQQSVLLQLQQSQSVVIPICHTLMVCYGLLSSSPRYPLVSPDDPQVSKLRSWPTWFQKDTLFFLQDEWVAAWRWYKRGPEQNLVEHQIRLASVSYRKLSDLSILTILIRWQSCEKACRAGRDWLRKK